VLCGSALSAGGTTSADLERGVEACRAKVSHLGLELLPDLRLVGKNRRAAGTTREQLVGMHGDDAGAVDLGELPHGLERAVRELGAVGRPYDCLEHDVRPFLDMPIVGPTPLDRIGSGPEAGCVVSRSA
jgi:hypothetical protein